MSNFTYRYNSLTNCLTQHNPDGTIRNSMQIPEDDMQMLTMMNTEVFDLSEGDEIVKFNTTY